MKIKMAKIEKDVRSKVEEAKINEMKEKQKKEM